jgi:putative GTP pyrophosphokinase
MNVDEVVNLFEKERSTYERFTVKISKLIEDLLDKINVSYNIEHRTKDINHFREKITRPGKAYSEPLTEVTDLCGIRIILRRISDVETVVKLLRSEFLIDDANSIYKSEELDVDQFGYTSIHLVIKLDKNRLLLTEWKDFSTIKAEIQVRTVLQHAWALISHSFDYKVGSDIPRQLRRRLFRLSALFELADSELDQIAENVLSLLQSYKKDVNEGKTPIELNIDSLKAYIETAPEVNYWIQFLRNNTGQKVESWGDLSRDIRIAKYCGISTLDEIKEVIIKAKGWGETFFKMYFEMYFQYHKTTPDKVMTVLNGIVTWLLIASNEDKFPQPVLERDFGISGLGSWYIVEAASKAKSITN